MFLSLVHLLRHVANSVSRAPSDPHNALYGLTPRATLSAAHAKLFGAPLAASLRDGADHIHALLGTVSATHAAIGLVVLVSAAATYCTQRLIQSSNPVQPEGTVQPDGTAATVQRLMRYAAPLSVLGSALFFPIGVLLYWCTSNLWTLDSSTTSSGSIRIRRNSRGESGAGDRRAGRRRQRHYGDRRPAGRTVHGQRAVEGRQPALDAAQPGAVRRVGPADPVVVDLEMHPAQAVFDPDLARVAPLCLIDIGEPSATAK